MIYLQRSDFFLFKCHTIQVVQYWSKNEDGRVHYGYFFFFFLKYSYSALCSEYFIVHNSNIPGRTFWSSCSVLYCTGTNDHWKDAHFGNDVKCCLLWSSCRVHFILSELVIDSASEILELKKIPIVVRK